MSLTREPCGLPPSPTEGERGYGVKRRFQGSPGNLNELERIRRIHVRWSSHPLPPSGERGGKGTGTVSPLKLRWKRSQAANRYPQMSVRIEFHCAKLVRGFGALLARAKNAGSRLFLAFARGIRGT